MLINPQVIYSSVYSIFQGNPIVGQNYQAKYIFFCTESTTVFFSFTAQPQCFCTESTTVFFPSQLNPSVFAQNQPQCFFLHSSTPVFLHRINHSVFFLHSSTPVFLHRINHSVVLFFARGLSRRLLLTSGANFRQICLLCLNLREERRKILITFCDKICKSQPLVYPSPSCTAVVLGSITVIGPL
jgi:hypothetical protein